MRGRAGLRPKPWRHRKKAISINKINRQIEAWAAYLSLADWNIAFSPVAVDENCRSNVEIDMLHRKAAIRISGKTPHRHFDRQIVHELLHVLFAGMNDAFILANQGSNSRSKLLVRVWKRSDEWVIERLTDIIVGSPRVEWGTEPIWREAFL